MELTETEKKILGRVISQSWSSFDVAEEAYANDTDEAKAFESLMNKLQKLTE